MTWDKQYEAYVDYVNDTGENPGQSVIHNGYRIGKWAMNQRAHKQKGILWPEREKKLNQINFDFNPKETLWNNTFDAYSDYIKTTGEPVRRNTTHNGYNIGIWENNQRQEKKLVTCEKIEKKSFVRSVLTSIHMIQHGTITLKLMRITLREKGNVQPNLYNIMGII